MSITDVNLDEFYRSAISEQLTELEEDLNQLQVSSEARKLTRFEYLALEKSSASSRSCDWRLEEGAQIQGHHCAD